MLTENDMRTELNSELSMLLGIEEKNVKDIPNFTLLL